MATISVTDFSGYASAAAPADAPGDPASDEEVKLELLRRAIERPIWGRSPIFIPLIVIAIAAANIPQYQFLWTLILSFLVITFLAAVVATKVHSAITAGQPTGKIIPLWLTMEFFGGATWGLMLWPISDNALIGPERAIITAVMMVTIAATCLISSNAAGMSKALIGGFMSTSLVIFIYHYDENGAVMIASSILMFMGLQHLVSNAHKDAVQSLKNELENRQLTASLAKALDRAQHLSRHDSLTGLLNRRDFEAVANRLRAAEPRRPMAIIMMDLDHFKSVNDRFGHAAGDEALKAAAEIINSSVRTQNISVGNDRAVARWGGEEFVVALANTDMKDAVRIAERIRVALAGYRKKDWPDDLTLTGSFGVTLWHMTQGLNQAIDRADLAMFDAKADGRNQIKTIEHNSKKPAAVDVPAVS